MPSPLEAVAAGMKEALLTIYQDGGNAGRVLFDIELSMENAVNLDDTGGVPYCDLVALTLFNLAHHQPEAFNKTFLKVQACVVEIGAATAAGASPETLAAIRENYGVQFRAA